MTQHTIPSLLELLFSTFPSAQGVDRAAQMQAYAVALDGHDMRDIEAAIWRLIRGEIEWHNGQFAPSAPLLGGVVVKMRDERLRHDKLMRTYTQPALQKPDVPPPTPEEKARAKAALDAFMAQHRAPKMGDEAKKAEEWSRVHVRFDEPQDAASLTKRLLKDVGYTVGNDAEGEAA